MLYCIVPLVWSVVAYLLIISSYSHVAEWNPQTNREGKKERTRQTDGPFLPHLHRFYIGHGQRFVTNSVRCTFLLLHCPHHPPRGTVNCITRMVHCNCTHYSVIILIKTRFILLINETISIEKGAVACDWQSHDNHTQSDIFGVSINPWPASQIAGFYHICLPGTRMFLLVVRAMTQGSCCCIRWWWSMSIRSIHHIWIRQTRYCAAVSRGGIPTITLFHVICPYVSV